MATILTMSGPSALLATVSPAWYSPSYGVRLPCVALDLEADEALDGRREYVVQFAR